MESLPKTPPLYKIGDRIGIRYWPKVRGRIVELRGPLGPGGAHIYRVRLLGFYGRKYSELVEDHIIPLSEEESTPKKRKEKKP